MMRHIVMFRFVDGYFSELVFVHAIAVFDRLKEELPEEIRSVEVCKNCISRQGNSDLAVIMELKDETSLDRYLNHPIHLEFVKQWLPNITARASFDNM